MKIFLKSWLPAEQSGSTIQLSALGAVSKTKFHVSAIYPKS